MADDHEYNAMIGMEGYSFLPLFTIVLWSLFLLVVWLRFAFLPTDLFEVSLKI